MPNPESPQMPGQPTLPSQEPETSAGYNLLEAIRSGERGRGYPGDSWQDNLLSPETNHPELIPYAMRYACAMVLQNEMKMIAERSKWQMEPHLYYTQDTERRLGTQRQVWVHQLNGEDCNRIGLKIPPRAEIPVIDEKTGIQKCIYVVVDTPLYYPDGTPVTDEKDGKPAYEREYTKKPLGVPVSDEQLEASILTSEKMEMWLHAWYWLSRDMVMERRLDNDIEALSESFGRYWRDNPYLDMLNYVLTRPELVPGKETEADMLQSGLDAIDKVGHMSSKAQGTGPRNIFNLDYSGKRLDSAINFTTAQILHRKIGDLPQDDKDRIRDLDFLHAQAIAHEALGLAHYLGIDEEYAVVHSEKYVKRDELLNTRLGDPPGTPILKIEVGRLTTTDRIKARHMAVRVRSELDHDCPFSVGPARYVARAIPNISLSGLSMISALRKCVYKEEQEEQEEQREQRLSFNNLKKMGVRYQDMPWIAEEWKGATVNGHWVDAHNFFDQAYGISARSGLGISFRKEGLPVGPRFDGLTVPLKLQEQYAANAIWVPLTDKDALGLFKTFSEASRLEGANKALYLTFTFLSGDLLIDNPDTIYKLIQYVKVLRLAAAEMAVTASPSATKEITFPLSRGTDMAGKWLESMTIRDILYNSAINAVYFSPSQKKWKGDEGKSVKAQVAEKELYRKICDKKEPVTPADTGWFGLDELFKLSKLYPYGVGFTQGQLYLHLKNGQLNIPQAKQLGYTGCFDQEELNALVLANQISREEARTLLRSEFTEAERKQVIQGQTIGKKPYAYCIWRQEDF